MDRELESRALKFLPTDFSQHKERILHALLILIVRMPQSDRVQNLTYRYIGALPLFSDTGKDHTDSGYRVAAQEIEIEQEPKMLPMNVVTSK